MSYKYAQKKRGTAQDKAPSKSGGGMDTAGRNIPNSVRLAMLQSGQAAPTAADKGRRVDMPEAMRAKMESSFGMDFSGVKLYESETLGQVSDAEAMAQGNEIAFAPGKLDFASQEGQARLGHELSHIASQARGEVHGNGFLLDGGLEARADREGAMAARGESVFSSAPYGGAVAPLSAASAAPMAGPMQAKGKGKKGKGKKGKGKEGKGKAKEEKLANLPQEDVEDREINVDEMVNFTNSGERKGPKWEAYQKNLRDLANFGINNGGSQKAYRKFWERGAHADDSKLAKAWGRLRRMHEDSNISGAPDATGTFKELQLMEHNEMKRRDLYGKKFMNGEDQVRFDNPNEKRMAALDDKYKKTFGGG